MHLEILVEDQSGKKLLDIIVPKIIGYEHTFRVIPYKGIGKIPVNLNGNIDASRRILFDRLPQLLKGYGKAFAGYSKINQPAVIVVCDLDNKCLSSFRKELLSVLDDCHPKPETRFCIAIEEGESWFFGDMQAIRNAFPNMKTIEYVNDSICGTWERLADAVYKGGSRKLSSQGYQVVGAEKSIWAEKITPHMDVDNNNSPSFCYFRDKLRLLVATEL